MPTLALRLLVPVSVIVAILAVACGGDSTSPAATPVSGVGAPEATGTPGVTDTGQGEQLDTVSIVELLRPSVVHILSEAAPIDTFGQVMPSRGVGTGVIIDAEGHIITNNHVITTDGVQPVESITVTLSDGRQFPARIVGRDQATDLAVLDIDAEGLPAAILGDSAALKVGEPVWAIGHALDLPGGPTVTSGVVSAKGRVIQTGVIGIPDTIQTDAAINPGNSGGPLVNIAGEVIGINTAIIQQAQGIGFAISMETAQPIVAELLENGRVERGFLGISQADITPSLAANLELPVERGVAVTAVTEGSPAAQGGLEVNDIIVRVAGEDVGNSGELLQVLFEHKAGETVEVEFFRGDQQQSTEVILGEGPG